MEALRTLEFNVFENTALKRPMTAVKDLPRKKKKKSGQAPLLRLFDDWSEKRLMNRASVVGIKGWQQMNKQELIEALRQG